MVSCFKFVLKVRGVDKKADDLKHLENQAAPKGCCPSSVKPPTDNFMPDKIYDKHHMPASSSSPPSYSSYGGDVFDDYTMSKMIPSVAI